MGVATRGEFEYGAVGIECFRSEHELLALLRDGSAEDFSLTISRKGERWVVARLEGSAETSSRVALGDTFGEAWSATRPA